MLSRRRTLIWTVGMDRVEDGVIPSVWSCKDRALLQLEGHLHLRADRLLARLHRSIAAPGHARALSP